MHRHTRLIQPDEEGLRFDLVEAEADQMVQPVNGVAKHPHSVGGVGPGGDPVGLDAGECCVMFSPSDCGVQRRGEAEGEGHRFHAGPPGPFLIAADDQGIQPQSPPHEECPDAGWTAQLVGGQRHQVGAKLVERDGLVAERAAGVDVAQHAQLPTGGHRVGDALTGAHLVVGPLQVNQTGCLVAVAVAPDRGEQRVDVDPAGPIDLRPGHRTSLGPGTHRRVLDGRGDAVRAAPGGAEAGGGDRLGPAGGEHDRSRSGTHRSGDVLTGPFQPCPGLGALGVDAAGVAQRPGPGFEERGPGLGAEGLGGGAVEVRPGR